MLKIFSKKLTCVVQWWRTLTLLAAVKFRHWSAINCATNFQLCRATKFNTNIVSSLGCIDGAAVRCVKQGFTIRGGDSYYESPPRFVKSTLGLVERTNQLF